MLLVESLQAHFGEAWRWSDIAEWINARARSELPRMWATWAHDYLGTRRQQLALELEALEDVV